MSAITIETLIPTGIWAVDSAHSQVGFAVKHMGITTARGTFDRFEGSLEVDGDLAGAAITSTIETASVNTSEEQRDAHLRSADFFDAETFPQLRFESTSIRPVDDETLAVTGELTMQLTTGNARERDGRDGPLPGPVPPARRQDRAPTKEPRR